MKIGAYYYPEQWPREQWERDFDNIADMGLQIVHMGEFAWFDLEPKPGLFQFDWLAHCLELAIARKLDVILCTPTAAPPIWLSQEFPRTLPIDKTGQPFRFGGRRHYNPVSPEMRSATRRIVTALADRFGNHPSVIGWQIDNEFSGFFDQSETTHQAFRDWLRNKYRDITKLNQAWGNQFWNTYYTDFDQIYFPAAREAGYSNPHQSLDASRFWSWAFADFCRMQANILKPKIGDRFLTTNFMPLHLDVDPSDFANDLTLFSWDSYPVSGLEKEGDDQGYRIADPAGIGLVHDQMASYRNRWALMEVQPGTINWSGVPVRVYPGAVRLWLWTAFAHGAEFVTTYRFRQPRFGVELFHHGLMGYDGVTPSAGGREFAQVIQEMRLLDSGTNAGESKKEPRGGIGLILDFEQLWWFSALPQARRWNQARWLQMWYAAISRLGVNIQVLRPSVPWPDNLDMVIAPSLQLMDETVVGRMRRYVEGGGNLVLTCRTGWMDRTGQVWEGPTAKPIIAMTGSSIEAYDSLRDDRFGKIQFAGKLYKWGVWGEQLIAQPDVEVLATYADQFYAGAAAITRRKHGAGSVAYVGVHGEQDLIDAVLQSLAARIAPPNEPAELLPPRVRVLRRGRYWIALNYQDQPVPTPAPLSARYVIGSAILGPADVAVWEE
ncbi:MAG: beta-galactosidase [Planctomycetota bacterium]|nr:beta-galactosidase [Planctomycetota bacterium]